MSVYMTTENYISELNGYAIYADARLGDNGDYWGMPEYVVGTTSANNYGFVTWDNNPDDGYDSGWRNVECHFRSSGSDSWQVQGGDNGTLQYSTGQLGDISKVVIRAGVEMEGISFQWRSLSLKFYNDGALTQTISIASNQTPTADTTSSGTVQERITTVIPTSSHNDEVIVTGQIFLHANQGVYPGGSDLFGEVLIYT